LIHQKILSLEHAVDKKLATTLNYKLKV